MNSRSDAPKPRNPAAHLRSQGALRTRKIPNKKKARVRGAKHKDERDETKKLPEE